MSFHQKAEVNYSLLGTLFLGCFFASLLIPISSAQAALTNGLALHYTYDGSQLDWASTTAEILDASGNNRRGNASGVSQSSAVAGRIGQALGFDGSGDTINAGSSILTGATSVSFSTWVYTSSEYIDSTAHVLIDDTGGLPSTNNGIMVTLDDQGDTLPTNGIRAIVDVATLGCIEANVSNVISTQRWYHIAFTYNGASSAKAIYIDGVSVPVTGGDTCTGGGSGNFVPDTNGSLYIGRLNTGGPALLKGALDDTRIYNRALSASEIKQLYNQGATKLGVTPTVASTTTGINNGLVGHWTFDGKDTVWTSATAATTLDKSGNGNTGTLTNMRRATSTDVGKIGQGIRFNGDNTMVNAGSGASLDNLSDITVSTWVKLDNQSANFAPLVTKTDVLGNTGWSWWLANQVIYWDREFSGTDGQWLALTSPQMSAVGKANKWVHVAVSYNNAATSSSPTIYVNGTSVTVTRLSTPTGTASSDASEVVAIGNQGTNGYPSSSMIGILDDVRIYNRILTASEVAQLYQLGRSTTR